MREALGRLWIRFRGLPVWAQVPIGIVAALFGFALLAAPFTDPEDREEVSSRATTSTALPTTTLPPTTTTTLPPLPAGDDTTVTRVIDGDTIEVADGTRVRFIGIDTPETQSGAECFGAESTSRTQALLPAARGCALSMTSSAWTGSSGRWRTSTGCLTACSSI